MNIKDLLSNKETRFVHLCLGNDDDPINRLTILLKESIRNKPLIQNPSCMDARINDLTRIIEKLKGK